MLGRKALVCLGRKARHDKIIQGIRDVHHLVFGIVLFRISFPLSVKAHHNAFIPYLYPSCSPLHVVLYNITGGVHSSIVPFLDGDT